MSEPILVSVVIPVLNGENHISRCLDSVLNQSLKNIQVIVVDDGSIDKTTAVVSEYQKLYKNILMLQHSSNQGTGCARNTGFSYVDSKYVAFLDADDWVDTNMYREMYNALEVSNAEISICGVRTEYGSPFSSTIRYSYPHENVISSNFALKLLSRLEHQDAFISPLVGNKLFRTSFLTEKSITFPNRSIYEDDEYMFLAFCQSNKIAITTNVFHHYYQRESSIMHCFSNTFTDSMIEAFQNIKMHLCRLGLFEVYKDEYYSFMDRCLASHLDALFSCEQKVTEQRKYICYLFEQLLKCFSMQELLANIDPERLHRIWFRS